MGFRRPSKPTMRSDACRLVYRLDPTGKSTVQHSIWFKKKLLQENKYQILEFKLKINVVGKLLIG